MQIQEWESTVRGAVVMEQAPVHGSEPNLTPEREGCPTYRDSQVQEEVTSASLLYLWPWLVYWPQAFEWHPKPELCTSKFPFVPDGINPQPVVLDQAEQVSCSECERPSGSLPPWSRRKLKASPGSLWAGERWLSRAGTTSWFPQGRSFSLRHAAQLWQNSWACIVLTSSASWSRNHNGS